MLKNIVRSVLREAENKEVPVDGFSMSEQGYVINKSLSHAEHTSGSCTRCTHRTDVCLKNAHLYRIFCKIELATSKDSSLTRTIS